MKKTILIDTNILVLVTLASLKPGFDTTDKNLLKTFAEYSEENLFIPNIITLEFEMVFWKIVMKKYKFSNDQKKFVLNSFNKVLNLLHNKWFMYPIMPMDSEKANEIYLQTNKDIMKISLIDAILIATSLNFEKLPIFTLDKNLQNVAKEYDIPLIQ